MEFLMNRQIKVLTKVNTSEENYPGFNIVEPIGQIVVGKQFIFDPIARFCLNNTLIVLTLEFSEDYKTFKILEGKSVK